MAQREVDPIRNPEPMGYPWEPTEDRDDPEAIIASLDCGCYRRVDDEAVLCPEHLRELNHVPDQQRGDPS